jgi:hypothetical protein
MSLNPFTSNNNIKVNVNYPYDKAATLESQDFYTDEQLNYNFSVALSGLSDVKTNNFSHLFLTKRKKLSEFFTINPLSPVPESFSTFFAFKAVDSTNEHSLYWQIDDNVSLSNPTTNLYLSEVVGDLQNQHFFDIVFLDQLTCRISHEHSGLKRLLTIDSTFNLSFSVDLGLGFLHSDDPQTFYYFYDDANDLLILYKKIFDYPYFVSYSTGTFKCTLVQPPLGPYFPFSSNGIMRMRPHAQPSSSYALEEHEATYKKDTHNNTLNTDDSTSRTGIKNNYLINAEYVNVSANQLAVNILSLKNELTPQNSNAFKSDFFVTDQFEYRQYNKIFSGTNQTLGNETISLGYDGYTQLLTFKPDTITYFHVPSNVYPYVQLNIQDTTLVKMGAIGGDHPVKADKIFKKRATYGDYGPYGNTTSEANGTFLCAWLSASVSPNTKPIWVDRYYNPSQVSFTQALTTANNTSYISDFQNLNVPPVLNAVFDKPSDLYFEPGVYYAYHHIGANDVEIFLKTLQPNTIQKGLNNYYINNAAANLIPDQSNEFAFDGQQYSVCSALTAIKETNQLTVTFDLNVGDWHQNFANQVLGNFISDGFGIFVQRNITPFLYYFARNSLYVYNTSGRLLHTLEFPGNIRALWRLGNLNGYYLLLENGVVLKCNSDNTIVNASSAFGYNFEDIVCSFYDLSGAVFVGSNLPNRAVIEYDFANNTFQTITSAKNVYTAHNVALSSCSTVVRYNNNYYGVSSYDAVLSEGVLYYQASQTEIRKWDLTSLIDYPLFIATTPIRSFNIDRDNNFWILNDTQFYKYSSSRMPILSGYINNNNKEGRYINFGNEITPNGEIYYTLISTHSTAPGSDKTVTSFRYNSGGVFVNQFDTVNAFDLPFVDQNITGDDYSRRVLLPNSYSNSINVSVVLNNVISLTQDTFDLHYDTDQIDSGYHNIAVRLDGIHGSLALFVDGLKVDEVILDPGKYVLSKTFERPMLLGSSCFTNNTTLANYLKSPLFYMTNSKIKNFGIYKNALNDFDIKFLASRNNPITTINYNIPAGKRGYVEEIERFFKQDVPIKRAAAFNMKLINLGNINSELQSILEARIKQQIADRLPFNATVNDVKWIN